MAKDHKSVGEGKGPINQHKRLAMGEKVTGMKKGGSVCMKKGGKVNDDAAEDKKMLKNMVKPGALKKGK